MNDGIENVRLQAVGNGRQIVAKLRALADAIERDGIENAGLFVLVTVTPTEGGDAVNTSGNLMPAHAAFILSTAAVANAEAEAKRVAESN